MKHTIKTECVMEIRIELVDYKNKNHAEDLIFILDSYAQDPMGGGTPLSEYVKSNLVEKLVALPYAFSIIAYADNKPAGLANCLDSFSTFQCKPIINIHDIIVHPKFRGNGISLLLLNKIEKIAKEKGCGKITLEVLEGNKVAQNAYKKFGFSGYELNPETGHALFWEKKL